MGHGICESNHTMINDNMIYLIKFLILAQNPLTLDSILMAKQLAKSKKLLVRICND